MDTLLPALLPVFSIILLGALFKRASFPAPGFWPSAAKITFYVFIPALLFNKLAHTSLISLANLPMVLALLASVAALSAVLYALSALTSIPGPSFSSIFQGSTRFNVFIGLALAEAFYGQAGIAMAAVAILGLTPLINILCVAVVTQCSTGYQHSPMQMILSIIKNPIVLSCIAGLTFNIFSLYIPKSVDNIINILDQASLPLGLLVVGSGLHISLKNLKIKYIALSAFFKLLLFPGITAVMCTLLHVNGLSRDIALLFTALPTATAGYILAQELGGNSELMAQIITMHIIISFFTLQLLIPLFS